MFIKNNQYFDFLKKYKTFEGRSTRKEYWFLILLNIIISVGLSFFWDGLGLIYSILVFTPSLAITIRRLHDVNKEGWYILIPIYNLVLLFKKGTEFNRINKFGPFIEDNKFKTKTIIILALISLILMVTKPIYSQQKAKIDQQKKEALYVSNKGESSKLDLKEWNEQSLKEVESSQTIEEIKKAYEDAPKGSQASLAASDKWISLCQTAKELKEANSFFPESSEARTKTFEKWKELSAKEIEQAQTIQDAKNAYENAPEDSDLKNTIYNKWNELSLKEVDQIKTAQDAKNAYENAPKGSQAKTKILEKWKELSTKEIEQVSNIPDMRNLFNNLPDDNELKNQAITKWISFCQSVAEIKEVYLNSLSKSEPQRSALVKWKELSNKEISQVQTIEDMRILYGNLPDDDKIKNKGIVKWLSLCQTSLQAKEVYGASLIGSDERKQAFSKWDELALKEVEQAQTIEEVRQAYNNTPDNSQSRKIAAEKMNELL